MAVQRVTADPKVAADQGLVALRYGPLISRTSSGQTTKHLSDPVANQPLTAEWRPRSSPGVMAIEGAGRTAPIVPIAN